VEEGGWRKEGGGGRGADLSLLGVEPAVQDSTVAGLPTGDAW
jgi:hypothetical protein